MSGDIRTKPELPTTSNTEITARATGVIRKSESSTDERNKTKGVLQTTLAEPVPLRDTEGKELIAQGKNNQWIVFGRDQITTKETGYGATSIPRAGAIEICVGPGGSRPVATDVLDPSPTFDAAKIYISQKANIDQHFKIASDSKKVFESKDASAIGIKADAVRIIGRENIKIVTGTDFKNSNGKRVRGNPSITLLGNNDASDVQPMVKGDNLTAFLFELELEIQKISGAVVTFLQEQNKINRAVIKHIHMSPFNSLLASESPSLAPLQSSVNAMLTDVRSSLMGSTANLKRIENMYLTRLDRDSFPILSQYNFLN